MSRPVVVLDAAALVDLLINALTSPWVQEQISDTDLRAPSHLSVEVLTALGGLERRGYEFPEPAEQLLARAARLPIALLGVDDLLIGAWGRRDQHSLADALYVELAAQLDTVVVTTDRRLARATPLAVAPPEE